MNSGNLLSILIQSFRTKFTAILTRVRLLTSWNYVKTHIFNKIRDFFTSLIGVKPRDKDDYFTVGRWMISKRLLNAAVIVIGVFSLWYITTETSLFKKFDEQGIKTYKYNSIRLRTAKGPVRITAKSGYLAYEGNVDSGYAEGTGTLYNKYGVPVYIGSFSRNKYEGSGTESYDGGAMHYRGDFHENLYEGTGTLYRENGTVEYEGEFLQGMKNGSGTLFDAGENEVYSGTFGSDQIVYSELLGKSAEEVGAHYMGDRELFMTPDESVVIMDEIGAAYHGIKDADALDDEEKVDAVYVLSDSFKYGNTDLNTIADITGTFGDPVYEGNSGVILPEAVIINKLNEKKKTLTGPVSVDETYTFSDVAEINGFDSSYVVYIYSYEQGDIMYSFVCNEKEQNFAFYFITEAKGGSGDDEDDA